MIEENPHWATCSYFVEGAISRKSVEQSDYRIYYRGRVCGCFEDTIHELGCKTLFQDLRLLTALPDAKN